MAFTVPNWSKNHLSSLCYLGFWFLAYKAVVTAHAKFIVNWGFELWSKAYLGLTIWLPSNHPFLSLGLTKKCVFVATNNSFFMKNCSNMSTWKFEVTISEVTDKRCRFRIFSK
jgi:hypothetical protein